MQFRIGSRPTWFHFHFYHDLFVFSLIVIGLQWSSEFKGNYIPWEERPVYVDVGWKFDCMMRANIITITPAGVCGIVVDDASWRKIEWTNDEIQSFFIIVLQYSLWCGQLSFSSTHSSTKNGATRRYDGAQSMFWKPLRHEKFIMPERTSSRENDLQPDYVKVYCIIH